MQLANGRTLREEFEIRRQDRRREEERVLDTKEDREKRDKKEKLEEQRAEDDLFELAATLALATETEITAFRVKLDTYDEAAVKALMENEKLREALQQHIDRMYDEAHILPDGRKVFKSRDGLRVYDENENEISREKIDPDEINDKLPRSEDFFEAKKSMKNLDERRDQIHEFQREADDIREELDEGDVTKKQLSDFEKRLADKMPPEVAQEMPDHEQSETPDQNRDFGRAAEIAPVRPESRNVVVPSGP